MPLLTEAEPLRIAVAALAETSTIELEGPLDLAGRPAAQLAISAVLDWPVRCVVLDLSRVTFIDSSGVHLAPWSLPSGRRLGTAGC